MIEALTWLSVGLGALGALLTLALALRRLMLAREARGREEGEARLLPLALGLLEGEMGASAALSPGDARMLAAVLARLGRRLQGDSNARIAAYLESTGGISEEIAALSDRYFWRRATAAFVLGDMGSSRAVPPLLRALGDPHRDVRSAAARSLGRLRALDSVEPLVDAFAHVRIPRAVVGAALLAIGPDATPRLRGLATGQEVEVRAAAIELIGLLGDMSAGALVTEALTDPAAEVRAKAAQAAARIGAAAAAAGLKEALDDRIPFVRAAAATALGMIGGPGVAESLLAVARDDTFEPAHAAARALARIDPPELAAAAAREGAGPHVDEAADLAALRR
ncbi:MAG: hypothetical protein QOF75_315 [Gaiellaceae bacterium]|nr:hypothetical protein [Gaiellaceae bacterium]